MGLDMYLTGRKVILVPYAQSPRTEDGYPIESIDVRLAYWRKHHNLHDYIVQGFAERGVQTHEDIQLDEDDLHKIIDNTDNLSATFDEIREYKETFTKALKWLKEGDSNPEPQFKPVKTEIGDTLQQIGLTVLEIDENTFPVKDIRYILYRASW